MSEEEVFQQDADGEGIRPGGPFLIHLLFQKPVGVPDKEKMQAVMAAHCGKVDCFSYDEKMAGFAALEHEAEFQDGKMPVQLMIMQCEKFEGANLGTFERSQMWDCMEQRDRILEECKHQIVGVDMLAAGLPVLERANLDMDFMEALLELYPECEAVYFSSCGKLFLAETIRQSQVTGTDRFIKFGVNARFFNIQGTEDMVVDTVGMNILFLPDLQYHFHGMDPNEVVYHAYNLASYILDNDNPIEAGETVDGMRNGQMVPDIRWKCQYEDALIQPVRGVLDVCMGEYASGERA